METKGIPVLIELLLWIPQLSRWSAGVTELTVLSVTTEMLLQILQFYLYSLQCCYVAHSFIITYYNAVTEPIGLSGLNEILLWSPHCYQYSLKFYCRIYNFIGIHSNAVIEPTVLSELNKMLLQNLRFYHYSLQCCYEAVYNQSLKCC
jgi:hypothetical protein